MDIKTHLKAHQFRFKKRYGQNFITDPTLLSRIAHVIDLDEEDVVLEIGAGAGTLTVALADMAGEVVAIEIDKTLIPILEEVTVGRPVTLVSGDASKMDFDALVKEKTGKEDYVIIANLPYYITTPLLMKALEEAKGVREIVIMVQKEVADRLNGKPSTKSYGAVTVMAQYLAEIEEAFFVSRKAFYPSPEVDSAVLHLKPYQTKPYQAQDEKVLRQVVKAAFGQRRKTLRNGLKSLGLPMEAIDSALEESNIEGSRRGESLSIAEFVCLADAIAKRKED